MKAHKLDKEKDIKSISSAVVYCATEQELNTMRKAWFEKYPDEEFYAPSKINTFYLVIPSNKVESKLFETVWSDIVRNHPVQTEVMIKIEEFIKLF